MVRGLALAGSPGGVGGEANALNIGVATYGDNSAGAEGGPGGSGGVGGSASDPGGAGGPGGGANAVLDVPLYLGHELCLTNQTALGGAGAADD